MNAMFRGSFVALPTPFRRGELDLPALGTLIDWHVAAGSNGLVVAGTSGESATLSDYERRSAIEFTVEHARKRLPVIAGTGTNNTRQSVELTRFAETVGADGALCVTPYYNKPTQRGLELHYGEVAAATRLPIVLYNVPSRTGVDLRPDTAGRIARAHANVVAIKEASNSIGRARELLEGTGLALLAGEDALIAEFMGLGAAGVIGVVANVAPREVAELCRVAAPGGDPARTAELANWLSPLVRDLFIETNPVPMKTALAAMERLPSAEVRLPLAPLEAESRARLLGTLAEAGLLARARA
jgi:4-hydroxy-tetrahydrodipicolinate synthase